MPNAVTKIAEATPSSSGAVANFSFTSIPATYDDLVVIASGKTDWTGASALNNMMTNWRFNASAATDYYYSYMRADGTTAGALAADSQNYIYIPWQPTSASSNDGWGGLRVIIPGYANTSADKRVESYGGCMQYSLTNGASAGNHGWANTSAISQINIYAYNNFVNGSYFSLYGIKNT